MHISIEYNVKNIHKLHNLLQHFIGSISSETSIRVQFLISKIVNLVDYQYFFSLYLHFSVDRSFIYFLNNPSKKDFQL